MGFIIPSTTNVEIYVEERTESFYLVATDNPGIAIGAGNEVLAEFYLRDLPDIIVLLQELVERNKAFIDAERAEHLVTPEARKEQEEIEEVESVWKKLGLSETLCETCGAHLKEQSPGRLICLNACHLGPAGKVRFQEHMTSFMQGRNNNDA